MRVLIVAAVALLVLPAAIAQTPTPEREELAVVELGGAASRGLSGGGSAAGLDFAIEWTPIEHWLELEAGTSPVFSRGSREWDTDLLFKKPWTLSSHAEFMLGIGPEWQHVEASGAARNSLAAELAGDFMYWPSRAHRFGWYFEPSFDRSFASGHERSAGLSAGLLIAIR